MDDLKGSSAEEKKVLEQILLHEESDMSLTYVSKSADKEKMDPFSVSHIGEKNLIFVPQNLDQLVKDNYLVRTVLKNALSRGYRIEKQQKVATMAVLKEEQINFLKGWGISLKDIPLFSKNINKDMRRGIEFGIYYMLDNKGVDRSLFKNSEVDDVNLHLFGNTWKTNFATEKRLVDLLKHLSRSTEATGELLTWMVPLKDTMGRYGLFDPTSNKLLSSQERNFLRTKFSAELEFKVDTVDVLYSRLGSGDKYLEAIKAFQEQLKTIQKNLRLVKDLVDQEVSQRGNFVFKHKLNKKGKKTKTFDEMVNNVKSDAEYANVFNPTLFHTMGKMKLRIEAQKLDDTKFVEQIISDFCSSNGLSSAMKSELVMLYSAYAESS